MALIPFYLRRPAAILKLPEAIARGLTPSAFIRELKDLGLSYRNTVMLADWASAAGIEAKKDVIKYVRKDYVPSMRTVADVTYNLSQEYMYKLKVFSRTSPDEPIKEEFINIMQDTLLRPAEVERLAWELIKEQSPKTVENVERISLAQIFHRIPAPLEED